MTNVVYQPRRSGTNRIYSPQFGTVTPPPVGNNVVYLPQRLGTRRIYGPQFGTITPPPLTGNMPSVIGLELADAITALVVAAVRVVPLGYFQADPVTVTWRTSQVVRPGFVISQTPAAGVNAPPNSPVNLIVSAYPMSVANYGGTGS